MHRVVLSLIVAVFTMGQSVNALACSTSSATVQLSWDSGLFDATGVQVRLMYDPALVDIPGSSTQASVASRVVNQSGASGLFGVADIASGEPPVDRAVNIGLVTSAVLAPGSFARVTFDCLGSQAPSPSDFSCWTELVTSDGSVIPSPSCTVAVATP